MTESGRLKEPRCSTRNGGETRRDAIRVDSASWCGRGQSFSGDAQAGTSEAPEQVIYSDIARMRLFGDHGLAETKSILSIQSWVLTDEPSSNLEAVWVIEEDKC